MIPRTKKSDRKPPAYRQRKGYDQAVVTLTDVVTKERRDYWLGTHGTPESWQLYYRLLSEWEANERRLPAPPAVETAAEAVGGPTISAVVAPYWRWAKGYYCAAKSNDIAQTLRLLRRYYGDTPAETFGPKKLRLLREEMVRGDAHADPPRRPWSRPLVNQRCRYLRHLFKWAASHELVSAKVHQQLRTVEPLRRGRTAAHEPAPVEPVAMELVDAIQPYVSRQVWGLVQLQLYTAARGCELFTLRPVDLDTSDEIWIYKPADHKTASQGKTRTIYFGPRAKAVLQPFLMERAVNAYLLRLRLPWPP